MDPDNSQIKQQTSSSSEEKNAAESNELPTVPDPDRMKNELDSAENEKDIAGVKSEVKEEDTPENEEQPGEKTRAYSYLDRDGFTSEIYKIEVHNLPKYVRFGQLKKKLTALELKPKKVKLINGDGNYMFAYVTFACEEDRMKALEVLNQYQWKGLQLSAKKANPKADPLILKRRLDKTDDGELEDKKRAKHDDLPPEEKLKQSIIPLSHMPYQDQLQKKEGEMKEVLRKLASVISRNNPQLRPWLNEQRKCHDGMACSMDPIKPSPVVVGYRNKNEFTIGKDLDGKDMVGFRYGSYRGGSCCVGDPSQCRNVPDKVLYAAKVFREYVASTSWAAFDTESGSGHWRMLTVRASQLGDIMVIAEFHPQDLTQSQLEDVKENMKTYFSSGSGKNTKITSLYFQANGDMVSGSNTTLPLQLVLGNEHMSEKLFDMTFQVSPNAFFQVNTLAAEVLYKTVAELCNISPETTLLDVCCGTGTIGLSMAKNVKNVFGIEMCKEAVDDAIQNAKKNGITNVEYWCSKAEDSIFDLTRNLRSKDTVAVVDPPRAGLHPKVVRTIRKCSQIHKLVYVSCSPKSVMVNFEDLIRPTSKRVKGEPFIPVKAVPVDLFPDTTHCEMVIVFERVKDYRKLVESSNSETVETNTGSDITEDVKEENNAEMIDSAEPSSTTVTEANVEHL